MLCIKPPMYAVGLAPMLLGAGLAYVQTGAFAGAVMQRMILGAILVVAWLNTRCAHALWRCSGVRHASGVHHATELAQPTDAARALLCAITSAAECCACHIQHTQQCVSACHANMLSA